MRLTDVDELKARFGVADKCDNCSEKMKAYCDANPDFAFTCELICKAPTVDAVPVVHGYWTEESECSQCGKYVYRGDIDNFCPHCGARMDVVREGYERKDD